MSGYPPLTPAEQEMADSVRDLAEQKRLRPVDPPWVIDWDEEEDDDDDLR